MKILFPGDPLSPRKVDAHFQKEASVARDAGFTHSVINFEELTNRSAQECVKNITESVTKETAIYRGWMMRSQDYVRFYNALAERNVFLVNTPQEYVSAHYINTMVDAFKDNTPKTIFIPLEEKENFSYIQEKLSVFEDKPIIIKDYVKSRKHDWHNACYINKASDIKEVARVTHNFIIGQEENLVGGLVYREYVKLSNEPEKRTFIFCGKLLIKEDSSLEETFWKTAQSFPSSFYCLDTAKTTEGRSIIIETGDGQVSEIPQNISEGTFYEALQSNLQS